MRSPATPERRSALDDHPSPPPRPSVSLVVPTYDEIDALDALVGDVLAQDYPGIVEIWFVDGESRDGTREALLALRGRDSRVRVLANPRRVPAAGFNLAAAQAAGDLIMRLDAHARYGPDVVRLTVEALMRTGAGGAGMVARPAPADTLVGRAIVAAHRSPAGVGVARFRREGAEGWAETVWNGCYWRFVLDRAGPMREDLVRAEDNDLNARIRGLGYGLYLTDAPRAHYRPRRTLRALWRQYRGNGAGVVRALVESPGAVGPRHLAPLALVGGLAALAILAAAWPAAWPALAAALSLYGAALILAVLVAARSEPGRHLLLLPAALATLHLSYGVGSLEELARRAARRLRIRRGLPRPRPSGS
jgi:GT2 family glycosyltransferase